MCIEWGGGGGGGSGFLGKSQVAIGFHRNSGTDPIEKQSCPIASQAGLCGPQRNTLMAKNL